MKTEKKYISIPIWICDACFNIFEKSEIKTFQFSWHTSKPYTLQICNDCEDFERSINQPGEIMTEIPLPDEPDEIKTELIYDDNFEKL